ncbi:MAG TPA: 30S ribosomal protein S7 [Candidatus Paceibacterota bacterium]|nr:30S ribosomal protein S7 [Candidatus Paceibacterota bacterium]HOL54053.1 30S ribosomal protein S7 [Candidatus Paceibacterota bacterium]HON22002.1 30S ribosomal protein S7 [Candidatus Paceibacterota bacterium]HOV88726.1 30S ribosomal protein S7 [Candidatus Paceibacterota bacterium]HPP17118.1 30S ribosomal protein S7 [Candidatus Paceibacterota bacterium]
MRKKHREKRTFEGDLIYNRPECTRFINYLMQRGQKATAEKNFYKAMEIIKQKTKKDPMEVFDAALKNVAPIVEVKSRRIGGANYQVPQEVKPDRQLTLACRWITQAVRSRRGKPTYEKLAEEIIAASNNEGAAVKKKLDTHRIAEANRAFAHFSW